MQVPWLETGGQPVAVTAVRLVANTSGPVAGEAILADCFPSPAAGPFNVNLHAGGVLFELVAIDYAIPRVSAGGWLKLLDPISAARRYDRESFGGDGGVSWREVLESRLPVSDQSVLPSGRFPAILCDGCSLHELLGEACRVVGSAAYRFRGGAVELASFTAPQEIELTAISAVPGGLRADVAGHLPHLGECVRTEFGDLPLRQIEVDFQRDRGTRCVVQIGSLAERRPLCCTGTILTEAEVLQLDPLCVRVLFEDQRTADCRAELWCLNSDGGRCWFQMPIRLGDRVCAAWPQGFSLRPLMVFPIGIVPPADVLKIRADRTECSVSAVDLQTDGVDIHD